MNVLPLAGVLPAADNVFHVAHGLRHAHQRCQPAEPRL